MRTLILSLLLLLTAASVPRNCRKNIQANTDWEERLKIAGFIADSVSMLKNPAFIAGNKTKDEGDDKMYEKSYYYSDVHLIEHAYDNACTARRLYDINNKYFRSDTPKYDKNDGPFAGLLQDNRFFEIRIKKGNDSLLSSFLDKFSKALLKNAPEKGTVYYRYAGKKSLTK